LRNSTTYQVLSARLWAVLAPSAVSDRTATGTSTSITEEGSTPTMCGPRFEGTVVDPGDWGRLVDGGAWLTIEGERVNIL